VWIFTNFRLHREYTYQRSFVEMRRDCIHSVLILWGFFLLKDSLCNTFIVLSLPCIKAVINGPLGSCSYPAPRYSWKLVNFLLSFYQIYGCPKKKPPVFSLTFWKKWREVAIILNIGLYKTMIWLLETWV
jgi:hypothetical protein